MYLKVHFIKAVITLLSKLMVEYINILDGPRGVELSIIFLRALEITHSQSPLFFLVVVQYGLR